MRPILSDDTSPPSACAQPGRAGVCSVCRTSPRPAGRCLDNQAEGHRDASFLCLLWFPAVPTRASTARSFELRLWPSSVLTRGRMRGLRTRGWALEEADFCYDRAGPWAVAGSVQRQLRCLQPAWPAGWEGAGAELARDAGSMHQIPSIFMPVSRFMNFWSLCLCCLCPQRFQAQASDRSQLPWGLLDWGQHVSIQKRPLNGTAERAGLPTWGLLEGDLS